MRPDRQTALNPGLARTIAPRCRIARDPDHCPGNRFELALVHGSGAMVAGEREFPRGKSELLG